MKTPLLVLLFAAALASSSLGVDADELLRQGLFEEEANRDPAKAAAAYAEVVSHYDGERKLAATAMFRLAEIRSKTGDKPAATALYQRLLAEFPDSDPLAKLSRERLAALGFSASPAPDAAPDIPTDNEDQELARFRRKPDFKGADFNSPLGDPPYKAQTPLIYAASQGWTKLLAYMIDQGAWVDDGRQTGEPLRAAAANGRREAVELLLARGAEVNKSDGDGWTALHAACLGRHPEIVRLLLDKGADPNAYSPREPAEPNPWTPDLPPDMSGWRNGPLGTPLQIAIRQDATDVMTSLLDHKAHLDLEGPPLPPGAIGSAPLFFALNAGREAAAQLLLARGAQTSSRDSTALIAAAMGSPGLVPALLDRGLPQTPDPDGRTPLFVCIVEGSAPHAGGNPLSPAQWTARFASYRKAWEAFLAHGADINARDNKKRVALHYVMPDDRHPREVAEWLLAHGADINAQDERKQTPFHFFCNKYFHEPLTAEFKTLIAWCIEHGADTDVKDVQGETPFVVSGREKVQALDREFRYPQIIPRYVRDRTVTALVDGEIHPIGEVVVRLAPAGELDAPPSLGVLLSQSVQANGMPLTISVHRANGKAGGESEVAHLAIDLRSAQPDLSAWPALRWGDVVLFLREDGPRATEAQQAQWNRALNSSLWQLSRTVHVAVGERAAVLKFNQPTQYPRLPDRPDSPPDEAESARVNDHPMYPWNPTAETLPSWTVSELVLHLTEGEPRAQLGAVRVERPTDDGKTQTWTLDLRAGQPAQAEPGWDQQPSLVKRMPSRLADGDRLIIPLAPAGDPPALAARRSAIRFGARGLLFAQPVFLAGPQEIGARTLGELLMQAYLHPTMIPAAPDFSKIIIHRLKGSDGEEEAILVDLAQSIAALDLTAPAENARQADVPLRWGDTVEIGTLPQEPESWKGFDAATRGFLDYALSRDINWKVNGQPGAAVRLRPSFGLSWEAPSPILTVRPPDQAADGSGSEAQRPFTASTLLGALKINPGDIVRFTLRVGFETQEFDATKLKALNPWLPVGSEVKIQQFTP